MDEIINSNKYCNIQESCKLLIQANNQYDKVVQQNQSLQQELKNARKCCENCRGKEDYSNMKRHCENAINSLKKERNKSSCYKQALEGIEKQMGIYQALVLGKPITMQENDCLYKIRYLINEAKKNGTTS